MKNFKQRNLKKNKNLLLSNNNKKTCKMPIISVFLSYVGGLSLLYHASIGIYLKKSQIQLYESYPTPVDFYSNILMKWLCFMLYLCIEDFLLIIFEIIPLGAWVLLMFKLYLISPRSEVFIAI